jgi:hypothetical protein
LGIHGNALWFENNTSHVSKKDEHGAKWLNWLKLLLVLFLDDIVTYENSLMGHDAKLRAVFEGLRRYSLKLQPDRCEFVTIWDTS